MWAIRLEHIIEMVEGQWPPLEFWDKYAAASNKDALFYRTSKLSYPQILEREKALLIRELGLTRNDGHLGRDALQEKRI